MEDKVKSLDEFINEDCGGDLEKARNLFKSVVQDILLSSEFDIENTVRNSAIKKHITKGEFSQVKQMLAEDINIVMEKFLKNVSELISETKRQDLDTLLQKFNTSDEEYKNFIEKLVSVENYFDKSKGEEQKIKEVYDKITSSLKPKNENNMPFADSHMFSNIVMLNNNRDEFKSIALNLQGEAINSVDNLSEEKKKEIEEWENLFVTLAKLKVWNPSPAEMKNTLSSLKSGSGFYIKLNWPDESIYNQLDNRQKELLEKMEKENADRALKKKCQEHIKSKIYGHKDDLFSILDAIAAVDLELCMRELDELTKSKEKTENAKENEKKDNENKIIINKEPNTTKEKEEKVKNIKEQLKHRARLLGFNSSNAFCDVIDKISAEPIDEFKNFVENCQDKFDEYQKDFGSISEIPEISTKKDAKTMVSVNGIKDANTKDLEAEAKILELGIVTNFYTEAKKQAREILNKKKENEKKNDNPKILAVEFVLDLMDNMDNMDNKNLNTEISEELRFLVNGTKQLDEKGDFGFENLSSIVKSMESKKDLLDQNSAGTFYNLLKKINSDYCKSILKAIDSLKKGNQTPEDFLTDILNQKNNTFVSEFFAFAFDDQQTVDQKLKYAKKFYLGMLSQFFIQFEGDGKGYEFLSLVFKQYFIDKIESTKDVKSLEPIIDSIKNFEDNFYLFEDPETSLSLLMDNTENITNKDHLDVFCDAYSECLKNIKGKIVDNRKLLVDLKKIFLDKNLDSDVAIKNISFVVNLLTKLDENPTNVQENDFEGLSKVLSAYAEMLIKDKITNEDKVTNKFPLLSETLKFQCKASTLKGFSLQEKQNLMQCMISIAKSTFAKNAQSYDENKNALKDYFWLHTIEIFGQKQFNETEAQEIYHFIEMETQRHDQDFNLLFNAIEALDLNDGKSICEMLNQDDNFKNILTLKNGEKEKKEKAYKSILKSLVKQRLNQKGGFVSSAYIKHYQLVIDNANAIADKQSDILSGVQNVLKDDFQPDTKILIAALDELKGKDNKNKALSDFWESCCKSEKDERQEQKKEEKKSTEPVNNQSMNDKAGNNGEENEIIIDTSDNKNEKKDISNNDKILDALSYIFIDLLKHDVSEANDENKINNSNNIINEEAGLDLVEITKEFVLSLYKANEDDKKEENINTNSKEGQEINEQPKKDNTGITGVLNKYYDTIDKARLSEDSLGMHGDLVLKNQINNFHNLDDDSKIKLLQCMKNIKDNSPTNDDLVYINLCAYEIKKEQFNNSLDNPFAELNLITDPNDNSGKTLAKFFQSCGGGYWKKVGPRNFASTKTKMEENQIKSVIKNIGKKEKMTDSQEKKNFVGAVVFVLEKQIQGLKNGYESNDYEAIDQIEARYKTYWKRLIGALEEKGLVSPKQKEEFDSHIDNACDLYAVVGALEWILALLGSIITLGILPAASKGIRKTLHSPLKSRKARYLIKSIDGDNGTDGIFSKLHGLAKDSMPEQEKNIKNNEIE